MHMVVYNFIAEGIVISAIGIPETIPLICIFMHWNPRVYPEYTIVFTEVIGYTTTKHFDEILCFDVFAEGMGALFTEGMEFTFHC